MSRTMLIAVALLLYLPLGLCGADAFAGAVFTLANKQMPEALSLTKWPSSWQAYAEDPTQRKRLQLSAAVGGFVWFGLPVLMGLSLQQRRKPLHGEARFASPAEIQQAALYGERGVIIGKVGKRYLIIGLARGTPLTIRVGGQVEMEEGSVQFATDNKSTLLVPAERWPRPATVLGEQFEIASRVR